MRGEFVDVGGARLYYYAAGTRGAGEPLVLLHGLFTSSHLWSGVAACLPLGHRTVILDHLGHGRSDPPSPDAALGIAGHADRALALLDALGIRRACLVGHGLGAEVAQAIAVRHPARVTRLALINAAPLGAERALADRLLRALIPSAGALPGPLLLGALRRRIAAGYLDADRGARAIDHYLRPFATPTGRDVIVAQLKALADDELTDDIAQITVPTIVATGDADPVATPAVAQALAARIPGATVASIGAVGHYAPDESPEHTMRAIRHLLERPLEH
ncbi:MAG TPA: alpha/beta fold hydrolase [Gemmatimonadaceae bacterium]|jgi:pimeloyl-ACP methyl ester carboxylesterase|nr:alpha/beta fold hydrolase [Gemmatimonadaceae bacterium]